MKKEMLRNIGHSFCQNQEGGGDFQTLMVSNHWGLNEVRLETTPSPLRPGGGEDSCAPDRRLNAPLEAEGGAQDLKTH